MSEIGWLINNRHLFLTLFWWLGCPKSVPETIYLVEDLLPGSWTIVVITYMAEGARDLLSLDL